MRRVGPEGPHTLDDDLLVQAENLEVLPALPDGAFDLVYIDPPFNTGRRQSRRALGYEDSHADYLAFLRPRLEHARRLLAEHGTLYVHLDPRESHYVKVMLDELFGRECFLNEIVWAYDYGGKPRNRWPAKHDTILVYVRTPGAHWFDADAVEREPYMAPGLVTAEKAARGKMPTDTWWHTIVPTNSAEKTGYPTQKPEGVVRRIVAASSRPGGWCLDFFAGSGTLGAVCAGLGRRYVLVERNPEAVEIALRRLSGPVLASRVLP
ncbi:MAG TPA: site-specific DNA-methyltransferase [Solirubrobacteraceae bacterium]|nr:site-specific DNA-methyltransferase [Solirubrobacteraceae bacterium]